MKNVSKDLGKKDIFLKTQIMMIYKRANTYHNLQQFHQLQMFLEIRL